MGPDYLFVSAGLGALCLALLLLFIGRPRFRRNAWTSLAWIVFGAGLLIQGFGPQMRVEDGQFVYPKVISDSRVSVEPKAMIDHERTVGLLAALLVGGGALALAWCYQAPLRLVFASNAGSAPGKEA